MMMRAALAVNAWLYARQKKAGAEKKPGP